MTTVQEQLAALQTRAQDTAKLIKSTIGSLTQEAKRFQQLQALYQAQTKTSDSMMSKVRLNNNSFRDIEEYHKLITSQVVPRLNQLHGTASLIKINLGKSITKSKAKTSEDHQPRVAQANKEIDDLEQAWLQLWREEGFLILNYRMDVSAKELQRWSEVMNVGEASQANIADRVNNIFQ